MPLISDTTTSGTATRRNIRMKMVPHGLTQSVTKCPHPPETAAKPSTVPSAIPIRIVIYSGNFFIVCNRQPFPIRDFHGTEAYARPDLVSGKSQTNITQNPGIRISGIRTIGRTVNYLRRCRLRGDVCRFPAGVRNGHPAYRNFRSLYAAPDHGNCDGSPADRKPPDRISALCRAVRESQLFDLPLDKLLDPLEFILFLFADERDPGTGRTRTAVRPIRWM